MGVRIGIDLCDEYLSAYCPEEKNLLTFPAVILREKKADVWHIGEEAFRIALSGDGVLTDKLMSLLKKGGTSTIARRPYTAVTLLARLLELVLSDMLGGGDTEEIDALVIAVRKAERSTMESVREAAVSAGVDIEKISVISREEAFIHYVLSLDKEISYNMVGLFDLSAEESSFYHMQLVRGTGQGSAAAESRELGMSFRAGILRTKSAYELADRLMTDAARKALSDGVYSAVLLTGRGFERTDWAKSFLEFVCKKRRVIYEAGLFAIGAALSALRSQKERRLIFCDTRTSAEVSLDVLIRERKSKLTMIPAGASWLDAGSFAEVLTSGQDFIDVTVKSVDRSRPERQYRIALSDFPERPDRCTRVLVGMKFLSASELEVEAVDLGFGDIFKSSGASVREVIRL